MPKVLAITTDAPFHVPGDGSAYEDQYYSLDEVIGACQNESIKVHVARSVYVSELVRRCFAPYLLHVPSEGILYLQDARE